MKNALLIVPLLSMLLPSATAKWRISPYAGMNVSRYHYDSPYTFGLTSDVQLGPQVVSNTPYAQRSANIGYTVGCNFEGDISKHFFSQFGIEYLKNSYTTSSIFLSGFTSNAVSLPCYFLYKTGQSGGGRFLFGAGMFGSVNFGGKTDGDITNPIDKMHYNNGYWSYRRYDIGPGAFVGYELAGGVNFKVTYKQGFLNQLLDDPNETLLNSNLSVTAGYFIGRKK